MTTYTHVSSPSSVPDRIVTLVLKGRVALDDDDVLVLDVVVVDVLDTVPAAFLSTGGTVGQAHAGELDTFVVAVGVVVVVVDVVAGGGAAVVAGPGGRRTLGATVVVVIVIVVVIVVVVAAVGRTHLHSPTLQSPSTQYVLGGTPHVSEKAASLHFAEPTHLRPSPALHTHSGWPPKVADGTLPLWHVDCSAVVVVVGGGVAGGGGVYTGDGPGGGGVAPTGGGVGVGGGGVGGGGM